MKQINKIEASKNTELPILYTWYEYTLYAQNILEKVPKKMRFVIVDKIIVMNISTQGFLIEAKYSKEKLPILKMALIEMEKIRFLYRLLFDTKNISFDHHEKIIDFLLSSSKMCNGWIKSCQN